MVQEMLIASGLACTAMKTDQFKLTFLLYVMNGTSMENLANYLQNLKTEAVNKRPISSIFHFLIRFDMETFAE